MRSPLVRRLLAARRDDRGAAATVFAVLLSGGVLLGMLALVVDVGQLYVERAELQSGADAAAVAIATACASGAPTCTRAGVRELAQTYADANASDAVSHVDEVCGGLPGVLDPCPAPGNGLTACLGEAPTVGDYVEVRLRTQVPDGRLILPPLFAQGVVDGFDGVGVGACARAAWQLRIDVPLLDIAMSLCDFRAAPVGGRLVLGSAGACPTAEQRGAVLDGPDPRCETVMPVDARIGGHLLTVLTLPVGGDCRKRFHEAIGDGETVYLPVYDEDAIGGTALDPIFTIVGAVGVVVEAFLDRTSTDPPPDSPLSEFQFDCDGARDRCLQVRVVSKIGPFALVGGSTLALVG